MYWNLYRWGFINFKIYPHIQIIPVETPDPGVSINSLFKSQMGEMPGPGVSINTQSDPKIRDARIGRLYSFYGVLGFDLFAASANISLINILIIWYENQSVSWNNHVFRLIYSSKVTCRQSFLIIP